jgi:hypothetical protein
MVVDAGEGDLKLMGVVYELDILLSYREPASF